MKARSQQVWRTAQVLIGGDAILNLRPLTSDLLAGVQIRCAETLARLIDGDLAVVRELGPLAEPFRIVERSAEWVDAATEILFPLELALAATLSWEGIADEIGIPVPPTRRSMARLLADPAILMKVKIALGIQIDRVHTSPPQVH